MSIVDLGEQRSDNRARPDVTVEQLRARAFTVSTEQPEADGTLAWDSTSVVLAEAEGGGELGLGFSYAAPAAAAVISDFLPDAVVDADAMSPPAAWARMRAAVRNIGYPGVAAAAISATDVAL